MSEWYANYHRRQARRVRMAVAVAFLAGTAVGWRVAR